MHRKWESRFLFYARAASLIHSFVLPGIFSHDSPAPSASADALHWSFPDGAVIKYGPESGGLTAAGIQTATTKAAEKIILFGSPEVECTTLLKTAQLKVT